MKQLAWLFLVVLCSAILLNAADNTMTGWVCDSACVVQHDNRTTCDPSCTQRSGNVVFISDRGEISAVSNPDICASHMNKHVRATYSNLEQKELAEAQKRAIEIQDLRDEGGIGGGGGK